jgi:2-hydroxycyclohexanecarboxyl-CoA dehydrogenase
VDSGLAGKTVVVTGATANIGRGIALAFAAEGSAVAVVGRDATNGVRVRDQERGRVINIGSTFGIVGDPGLAAYSAMKGAVPAFTRVLAKEVGSYGITVNAIAPYGTLPAGDDEVSRGSRLPDGALSKVAATKGHLLAAMARNTVLDRQFATPADVASAAVYLASDAAAFVTAQVLAIDGGTLVA